MDRRGLLKKKETFGRWVTDLVEKEGGQTVFSKITKENQNVIKVTLKLLVIVFFFLTIIDLKNSNVYK